MMLADGCPCLQSPEDPDPSGVWKGSLCMNTSPLPDSVGLCRYSAFEHEHVSEDEYCPVLGSSLIPRVS